MKFFNFDVHISVIADLKHILEPMGVEVSTFSLSGHNWVFGKRADDVKIITQQTWQELDDKLIQQFQAEYDEYLSSFDGFIVGHPFGFIQLYEKYNKPIIAVAATRYDAPYTFTRRYDLAESLDKCIQRLHSNGLLYVIANNRGDKDYFGMSHPNIPVRLLPSLCEYTGMKWNKNDTDRKFLVYSRDQYVPDHPLCVRRRNLGHFNWNDLTKYRAIIHIPYEVSTMSVFEQLSAGFPLFFPTKRFLKELWTSTELHESNYWKRFGKVDPPAHLSETNSVDFWIDRCDFYDIPGLYYFDSFDDLFLQIIKMFKDPKYEERMDFITKERQRIINEYGNILEDIRNKRLNETAI